MRNLINEIQALRSALSLESVLREAANEEFSRKENPTYLEAHGKSITQVVELARLLVLAADTP